MYCVKNEILRVSSLPHTNTTALVCYHPISTPTTNEGQLKIPALFQQLHD
jgi:hypothetical protein